MLSPFYFKTTGKKFSRGLVSYEGTQGIKTPCVGRGGGI